MIAQIDKHYVKTRPLKVWSRIISFGLFEGRPVTTRGKWINPILFKLFKFYQLLPQLKKVNQPIFIIGTGRSGTTLLGKILSIHREISFLNEPKALWHVIYDKEDIIGSYSDGEAFYFLNGKNAEEKQVVTAHKLYGAYLAFSGGKRALDKYPELIFRVQFVKKIFPNALFLFITRNGKNTLQSIKKWSEIHSENLPNEVHNWWGVNDRKWKLLCKQVIPDSKLLSNYYNEITALTDHIDRAAVEWIVTMEQGLQNMEECGNNILKIRYEDLLSDKQTVLNEIFEFAHLENDEKLFMYADQVIHQPTVKNDVTVKPFLKRPFDLMMEKLGY